MTIEGGCLCGGVRFEIDDARSLTFCHCVNCRKLSGAAFASYVHVDTNRFRLLTGEGLLERFESAPGSFRNFCRRCSSPAPGKGFLSGDGEYSCRLVRQRSRRAAQAACFCPFQAALGSDY